MKLDSAVVRTYVREAGKVGRVDAIQTAVREYGLDAFTANQVCTACRVLAVL
jgi:hypothetical protein